MGLQGTGAGRGQRRTGEGRSATTGEPDIVAGPRLPGSSGMTAGDGSGVTTALTAGTTQRYSVRHDTAAPASVSVVCRCCSIKAVVGVRRTGVGAMERRGRSSGVRREGARRVTHGWYVQIHVLLSPADSSRGPSRGSRDPTHSQVSH